MGARVRGLSASCATGALALVWCVPPVCAQETSQAVDSYRLPNGVSVRLEVDRAQPFVGLALSYGVGSADDPEGYAGLAHVVEHLLFERGLRGERGRWETEMARAGVTRRSGSVSLDTSDLFALVPPEQLPRVLWFEAQRAAYLLEHLTQADVELAREAVLREVTERNGDASGLGRYQLALEALYGSEHRYGGARPTEDELDRIDLAAVRWFVQSWYRPRNLTVALVGDFEPDACKRELARYFGALRPAGPAATRVWGERAASHPKVVRVGAGSWWASYVLALTSVLARGGASRLFRELRWTSALSYGPCADYFARDGWGVLITRAVVDPQRFVASLDILLGAFAAAGESAPSEQELQAAKAVYREELRARIVSAAGLADRLATDFAQGMAPGETVRRALALDRITRSDLQRLAQRYLAPERARVVAIGDYSYIAPPLMFDERDVEYGDVDDIYAE